MIASYFSKFNEKINKLENKSILQSKQINAYKKQIDSYNSVLKSMNPLYELELILQSKKAKSERKLIETVNINNNGNIMNVDKLNKRSSFTNNSSNIAILKNNKTSPRQSIETFTLLNFNNISNFNKMKCKAAALPSNMQHESYLNSALKNNQQKNAQNSNSVRQNKNSNSTLYEKEIIKSPKYDKFPLTTRSNKSNTSNIINKGEQNKRASFSLIKVKSIKDSLSEEDYQEDRKRATTALKKKTKNLQDQNSCINNIYKDFHNFNNFEKALLILTIRKVVPVSLRSKICLSIPFIRRYYSEKYILNDLIDFLTIRKDSFIKNNEIYYSNEEVATKIKTQFQPSKTLFTFLNMITAYDEQLFREESSNFGQLMCRLIIIVLLNHRLQIQENHDSFDYISYFYAYILPKYGKTKLKEILFYTLIGNIHFTCQSYCLFRSLIDENAHVFDLNQESFSFHSKIIKILAYFIIEVNKFADSKCTDGKYIFILRLIKKEEETLKERIKRLKLHRMIINQK